LDASRHYDQAMSLRMRLIVSVVLVLAVTMTLGGLLAAWHAAASVQTEMRSALAVGEQTVRNGLDELQHSADPARDLRHLVTVFDGNRHLRVTLTGPDGQALAVSRLATAADPPPDWFIRLVRRRQRPVIIPVPPDGTSVVTLAAVPNNEVSEVWSEGQDGLQVLAAFCVLTTLLIHWTLGRALRPLETLSGAFGRIGSGDYTARVSRQGPPELAGLAVGFNRMAEMLDAAQARNRRLDEQLLTLQDEERADLARDLHDEVGPFLFAVAVDAASIPDLATQPAALAERVKAIREAVVHMQGHIRSILVRLRPAPFGGAGLGDAVGTLVAFWRSRHPDIIFAVAVPDAADTLPASLRATIGRVVQESVSNAVRHGRPGRIEIGIELAPDAVSVRVSDDGIGMQGDVAGAGFGLLGMQERVAAQSGTLTIGGVPGRGLTVTARFPLIAAMTEIAA
jgi:two-component system sensor histidine kinase UhpB